MTKSITIGLQAFTTLRREGGFLAGVCFLFTMILLSFVVASWSVDSHLKIVMDFTAFACNVIGSLLAIQWSLSCLQGGVSSGLLIHFSSGISKIAWFMGCYLGVGLALGFLSLLSSSCFVFLFYLHGYVQPEPFLAGLGLQLLGWLVVAAMAFLFSSLCQLVTGFFATVSLWIAGLSVQSVSLHLPEDIPVFLNSAIVFSAKYFDLQVFNPSVDEDGVLLSIMPLEYSVLFGLCWIMFFLSVSFACFYRQDLANST